MMTFQLHNKKSKDKILVEANLVGSSYMAKCPNHDDKTASLSIDKEKGVFYCHGCGFNGKVINDAGGGGDASSFRKGFVHSYPSSKHIENKRKKQKDAVRTPKNPTSYTSYSLTLEEYASAKGLSTDFLKSVGVRDCFLQGSPAIRIPYYDAEGIERSIQFRLSLNGDGRFKWRKGDKAIPYGLSRLKQAKDDGYCLIVEGASDSHTLWQHKIPAIGVPGAGNWRAEYDDSLNGIGKFYFVKEPDAGGKLLLDKLKGLQERLYIISSESYKDVSELYLSDRDNFVENLKTFIKKSICYSDINNRERDEAAKESYAAAESLLHDPDFFGKLRYHITASGYAGDTRPVELGYISLTSRLLNRPLNLAYIAASASGKNESVDKAVNFFPPTAYHLEKAGSALALIYNGEEFTNKIIIFAEADSIPDEGSAASAIRSIATDNVMTYDVVEKNAETGQFKTRRITKAGPTGLITTAIKSLRHQLGTRVIEVPISDTSDQTRKVMHSLADAVNRTENISTSYADFRAVQEWLEIKGNRKVAIPYANILADKIPSEAVRMRRDFKQLLTIIQTVSLIHQCQRNVDKHGRIIAEIEDYRIAREIILEVFDCVINDGITKSIRAVVDDVVNLKHDSYTAIANSLKLSRSTVQYRVKRAIQKGWILREEKTKKIIPGEPLPEPVDALPTAEGVKRAYECTKGVRKGFVQSSNDNNEEIQGVMEGCMNVRMKPEGESAPPPPPKIKIKGKVI